MTIQLEITALTSDEEIMDAIPFLDMREFALCRRNDAKAPYEAGDDLESVLELHEIDGITVLWDPIWACCLVNEASPGVGDSLILYNGEAMSPEEAAKAWRPLPMAVA